MMIRKRDLKPVYISDNITREFGFQKIELEADIVIMERIAVHSYVRTFWKAFHQWQEQGEEGHLKFEFEYALNRQDHPVEDTQWGELDLFDTSDRKYYLMIIRNITDIHQEKEALKGQIAEAVRVERSKTAFLSQMSHEIRTPMNGIIGMISLAKMNYGKPKVVEDYLGQAENLSNFLLSIINDILDMSRIESGKIELEHAEFDLYEIAGKLQTMFASNMESKGITFQLSMEDFTIRRVVGDELRLTQVITNFLSNAGKFTSKGGTVSLTFKQLQIWNRSIQLMIRVRDTGKGMSPEFLSRIFKPFEQESTGIARNYGGSGLGMSIADNLIRLMDGQIVVDSEEGKGSDFTVYVQLPIAQGEVEATVPYAISSIEESQQQTQEADSISLEGMRFLMAEDNEINAMVATRLFASQKVDVEVAVNGLEAVRMFESREQGYYDGILMDIQMPVMDGWEATQHIRESEKPWGRTIPIFALSADAFVEDKRHSRGVGMNGHISKPINFEELKTILGREILQDKG